MLDRRICIIVAVAFALLPPRTAPGTCEGCAGRGAFASENLLASGDVRERTLLRLAAARAVAEGQDEEADGLYRELLRLDPWDDQSLAALEALSERRVLPRDSWAYQQARTLLPARFVEHETRRFIVLSDANSNWTRTQAEHLERAWHQFHRFAKRLEMRPLPPRHKLVCVLFERHEDYQQFAAVNDNVTDVWIAGYYSPRFDRIVFYNVESEPSIHRARSTLEHMHDRVERLAMEAGRALHEGNHNVAHTLRREHARHERHFRNEQGRVDEFTRTVGIATTVHEAIHQIAFHTRIQSPHAQYPLWISEGLATAFETAVPNEAFGPDHEFAPRRDVFLRLLADDELIPLRELVMMNDLVGADDRTVTAMYHQGYALVTWMSRFRRAQLRDYLNAMLAEPAGPVAPERHLEIFRNVFGDIDRLERVWLRHEFAAAGSDR